VEQLNLFETGELIEIRHYLTCWNEAQRAFRLAQIKNPRADCLGKREDGK